MKTISQNIPGILFTLILSVFAYFAGKYFPIIGPSVFGIVFGIIIKNSFKVPKTNEKGINFTSKKILQFSIILLGGTLNLQQISETGIASFSVMVFTISIAFLIAYLFGKYLKVRSNLKNLIGVGTAICGGSAIAALSSVIDADENDISYSISTVFLYNLIAVLIFPLLGHLIGLSDYGFGLFAGTAINDTSSVVAAAFTYSDFSGNYATIVKLTRTTMIIPVCLVFAIIYYISKNQKKQFKYNFLQTIPWFLLGFLIMALCNSLGIIEQNVSYYLKEFAKFSIVMSLTAIGLKTDFKSMMQTGVKPLLLGLIVWISVTLTSLVVQFLTKQM